MFQWLYRYNYKKTDTEGRITAVITISENNYLSTYVYVDLYDITNSKYSHIYFSHGATNEVHYSNVSISVKIWNFP